MGFCYSAPQKSGGQEKDCRRPARTRKRMKPGLLPSFYCAFTVAEVLSFDQEVGKCKNGRSNL